MPFTSYNDDNNSNNLPAMTASANASVCAAAAAAAVHGPGADVAIYVAGCFVGGRL